MSLVNPEAELEATLRRFDYALPEGLVARHPPARRDGGRLLVLSGDGPVDQAVVALPGWLREGDLLVVNDTRVLHARLFARRETGGRVELLALGPGEADTARVRAMVHPGRRLKVGEELQVVGGGVVRLLSREADGSWQIETSPPPLVLMERVGHVPLPPYLQRADEPADRVRYQTVYAGQPGAVAAPTAGLHLSDAVLQALQERGVGLARVTLHVGPGTFRNLRAADLRRGELHAERWAISPQAADAIARTRARGGRVVAVGTTTTRTLESAADSRGRVRAGEGETRLFIREGFQFKVVDALLTNFHLPRSSLLMLVSAFGGYEEVRTAYLHAVATGYRFYSYGDAMFIPHRGKSSPGV